MIPSRSACCDRPAYRHYLLQFVLPFQKHSDPAAILISDSTLRVLSDFSRSSAPNSQLLTTPQLPINSDSFGDQEHRSQHQVHHRDPSPLAITILRLTFAFSVNLDSYFWVLYLRLDAEFTLSVDVYYAPLSIALILLYHPNSPDSNCFYGR